MTNGYKGFHDLVAQKVCWKHSRVVFLSIYEPNECQDLLGIVALEYVSDRLKGPVETPKQLTEFQSQYSL